VPIGRTWETEVMRSINSLRAEAWHRASSFGSVCASGCVRRPHLYGSAEKIQKYALFEEGCRPSLPTAPTRAIVDKSTCVHVAFMPTQPRLPGNESPWGKKIWKSPWQLGAVSGSLLSAKTIYRLADKGSNHLHDSSTNRLGGFSAAPRRATPGRPGSSEPVSTVKDGPVPSISKPELNL
jgi:hypothetical protein